MAARSIPDCRLARHGVAQIPLRRPVKFRAAARGVAIFGLRPAGLPSRPATPPHRPRTGLGSDGSSAENGRFGRKRCRPSVVAFRRVVCRTGRCARASAIGHNAKCGSAQCPGGVRTARPSKVSAGIMRDLDRESTSPADSCSGFGARHAAVSGRHREGSANDRPRR